MTKENEQKKENGVSTKYKEQNYYNDYYKLIVELNRLAKMGNKGTNHKLTPTLARK